MAVQIIDKKFTYSDGSETSFYQCNAGDRVDVRLKILEQVQVISGGSNYLTFDLLQKTITFGSGNWLVEGFRQGEQVSIRKYDSVGNLLFTSQIYEIVNVEGSNYSVLRLDQLESNCVPDQINGEIVQIYGATDYRRKEIVAYVNHVQNNQSGNEFSLIDGESTGFRIDLSAYPGYPFIPGGTILDMTPFGKQSGQFVIEAQVEMLDESPTQAGYFGAFGYVYNIKFSIIQSGIYDQDQFNQNFCLKLFSRIEFAREVGEPFQRAQCIFNLEANTGWFNEPYNVGFSDAQLVQGITEIGYDSITNAQIIIEAGTQPTSDIALGFSYIPNDEDYYKNKITPQQNLGMTIPSTPLFALNNYQSPSNPDGANYIVNIINTNITGSTITIDLSINPDPLFDEFMSNRDSGDQLFYVWAKVGNINLLVFEGQLTSNPPIAGNIDMITAGYYDHSGNITDIIPGVNSGYNANIEDDLSFVGSFKWNLYQNIDSFLARIEAYNSITGESFTLSQVFFGFGSIPQVSGKYILNESLNIYSILPTTSEKRNALLILDPSLDTPTEYGVKIYFPFIYRWEYWLEQSNANNDFYPNNQTKNWFPYGNTGDWKLRLHLEYESDNLGYVYDDIVEIKNYDSDPNIFQKIDLYIESTNQQVNIITEGLLMRIEARHQLVNGYAWEQSNLWGMITAEPKESASRYLLSTIVPFDNDINNPLIPISGNFLSLSFPSPDVALMKCYFDSNKINLENGVKFTTKIKGCSTNVEAFGKETTDGIDKETTYGELKIIS
jgi:hypothetical protein